MKLTPEQRKNFVNEYKDLLELKPKTMHEIYALEARLEYLKKVLKQ